MVTPASGEGRGNHRKFSVVQAVALKYAKNWAAERASLLLVRGIVEFLTSFTEEELLAEFEAGRKILIPVAAGRGKSSLVEEVKHMDCSSLNIEIVYREVTKKISRMEKKQKPNRTGRNRGLVSK